MSKVIRGAGGGGGKGGGSGGHTPVIAADSLRSKSYARVVDLISEGEIEGLVDGAKSIYLDETPLQNPDGSYNFSAVNWKARVGTQNQSSISGFSSVENTAQVNVQVKNTAPVTRQFTNPNLDMVYVTIGIPALYFQDTSTGDVSGSSVKIAIDVQSNGGGFKEFPLSTLIDGSYTSISGGVASNSSDSSIFDLTAAWDIDTSGSKPTIDYKIQYKIQSSSTWLDYGSYTLSNEATSNNFTFPGYYGGGSATTTKKKTHRISLASGKYNFRVVKTNGSVWVTTFIVSVGSIQKGMAYGGSISIDSLTSQHSTNIDTITGKTGSRYQRTYKIPLTGSAPWDVRIRRITGDSTSDNNPNQTWWDTYTEVINAKLRYPNSALVAMSVDASQFSTVPRRGYDVKLLKVRVPSNYNPLTREYTGSWDGMFNIAWTDNPAWCFYDLLTTARYGLGAFINASQVDKWALYAIGKYCDELIPDGFGGLEPRFTCNLYMQTKTEAYKVVQDMASIFRGLAFWSTGAITAMQDAPSDVTHLYNAANVIDGTFNYSGSSAKARHTVALVSWNDPDDFYRQKVEYVEDADGISRYGVVTTEVVAVGCTSRGQAYRVGKWLLFSEINETETISFKAGMDANICRPGQIIAVADPARAGVRLGGRIAATGTSSIGLDSTVALGSGTYTFMCIAPDGSVQESTVTNTAGTYTTLNLSPSLPVAPLKGGIWVLTSNAVSTQLFRVLAVLESEKNTFEVTALAHDPNKFNAVEQNLVLEPRSISALSDIPAIPTGITLSESLYAVASDIQVRLSASWSHVLTATKYIVTYSRDNNNISSEIETFHPSVDINNVSPGTYTVYIQAVNGIGKRGGIGQATLVVAGKTAPPSNVDGFTVSRSAEVLNFTWLHVPDLDRDYYEIRKGQLWASGISIGATKGNSFSIRAPRGGSFMIKAIDTSGLESASATLVVVPDTSGINVIYTYSEPVGGWNGTLDGVVYVGFSRDMQWNDLNGWDTVPAWGNQLSTGGLTVNSGDPWSSFSGSWSSYLDPWVFIGGSLSGSYISEVEDVGVLTTAEVTIEPTVEVIPRNLTWNTLTDVWANYAAPTWTWQGKVTAVSANFEISTSNDNITWSQWRQFVPGAYTLRYVRFKITLMTDDSNYLPFLTGFTSYIDVPDRVIHFEDVSVGTSGVTLNFNPPFVNLQTVQATLQSSVSGDRFTVTNKTNSSVKISVFDSTGTPKSGIVDVDAFGYGEST